MAVSNRNERRRPCDPLGGLESAEVSVADTIRNANRVLPGPPDENDTSRWHAVFEVSLFVESHPEDVWGFVQTWGGHELEDLRDAIACSILEHLLEYHFDMIFPRVEESARKDTLFADMFCRCWKFGQSEERGNAERFDHLQRLCQSQLEK